jgi:hypothetical protein
MEKSHSQITILSVKQAGHGSRWNVTVRCVGSGHFQDASGASVSPFATETKELLIDNMHAVAFADGQRRHGGHTFGQSEIVEWMQAHPGQFDLAKFVGAKITQLWYSTN